MKSAVVFYSLDGNSTFVARQIKTLLNADLIQLQLKDDKKRGGFFKMLWGGGMAVTHKKPPLKPYTFDPSAYDLILIGAPVWAGSPAPPVQTFLSETSITGKKIALFVCHAGGKRNALDKFKSLLPGNEIVAETDFRNPVRNSEGIQRQIADWVKGFIAG
jgi:flavodoxin